MYSKKIVVFRSTPREEKRVAMTPLGTKKLKAMGWEVWIESGSGVEAGFSDQDYENVGATISKDLSLLSNHTSVVLCVTPPTLEQVSALPSDCAYWDYSAATVLQIM